MHWLQLLSYFFGGSFLAGAIPHAVSGMMGRPFQTAFARPPGKGLSSPTVNVLYGFFMLVVSYVLVCHVGDFALKNMGDATMFGAGACVDALVSARQFGRFKGGAAPGRS